MRTTLPWLVALLLLGSAAASSQQPVPAPTDSVTGLPIPPDLRVQIARSCAIGRRLYVFDKVAALGTDVLFEHVKDPRDHQGLSGYLPMQENDDEGKPKDSFLVSFFTTDTPPRIAYEIRVASETKPAFQSFSPPKAATPVFAAFVRARQLAIATMPASDQPMNPVLVPGEANGENGILVYLLAGTKKSNVAVFGRHFRSLVPFNGAGVTYMMPLSNTVLEIPTRGPNGETPEALMVNHIVTDFPLETHVFTSLLVKTAVYVTTRRGDWHVDGDRIAFVRERAPKSPE